MALTVLNRTGVMRIAPYILIGTALWVFVLKSGVHATLAGRRHRVVRAGNQSQSRRTFSGERSRTFPAPVGGLRHPAAVRIYERWRQRRGAQLRRDLLEPIPLGIMLGLFVGKQLGVFTFAWVAVKSGLARLPDGVDFSQVYGAAILCGIGFTMSLFIGMLAFENTAAGEVIVTDRLGILAGTFLSAVYGAIVLHFALPRRPDRGRVKPAA